MTKKLEDIKTKIDDINKRISKCSNLERLVLESERYKLYASLGCLVYKEGNIVKQLNDFIWLGINPITKDEEYWFIYEAEELLGPYTTKQEAESECEKYGKWLRSGVEIIDKPLGDKYEV